MHDGRVGRDIFSVVKRLGLEAENLPQCNDNKNKRSYISPPHTASSWKSLLLSLNPKFCVKELI